MEIDIMCEKFDNFIYVGSPQSIVPKIYYSGPSAM